MSGLLVLVLGASVVVASESARDSEDPVLGTWNLVVEKSIYDPGPAPRSQKRIYEAHPDGVKARILTVDAAGRLSTVLYVADYDSMEYPLVGTTKADALALVRPRSPPGRGDGDTRRPANRVRSAGHIPRRPDDDHHRAPNDVGGNQRCGV